MAGQSPYPSQAESSSAPISRRELLRTGAAATVGLAGVGLLGNAAGEPRPAAGGELVDSLRQAVARTSSGPTILKQQATADYQANMREFGGALASPIEELLSLRPERGPTQADIVIVGSGYGAAVCAARLAQKMRPGTRLVVLERGREWPAGSFPDTRRSAAAESRFDNMSLVKNRLRNPLGLYSAARFDEVNVLTGNGLGGGSLINANVAYRPDPETFDDDRWPAALQDARALAPYYDRALYELDPQTEQPCASPKSGVIYSAAERLAEQGGRIAPANITITRGPCDNPLPILNRQGLRQRACVDCGDCNTGCNVGAKHTLAMNYLPLARRHGARIFTQCEAVSIEPLGGYYRLHFKHYHPTSRDAEAHRCYSITSRVIVLGAGSLGSTELLLRSQVCHNLSLSGALGRGWSANGDAIGFVSQVGACPTGTNIGGHGTFPATQPTVGPTIQTNLTFPERPRREQILIQEGAVARAYANVLGLVLRDMDFNSTMMLFAMGHDDAAGRITLDGQGRSYVRWPGLSESDYRKRVREEFTRVGMALGGKYHVLRAFGDNLVTVHPLGGCGMADDPDRGVTTDRGEIWYPEGSLQSGRPAVHAGLYVADAAIFPAAIGVNPFLTIAALAERVAEHLTSDPQWSDLFATG